MLYWGIFKACGYRYNEENMQKLFVKFPWAAYCDELIDPRDIASMLKELAGFGSAKSKGAIRWTQSRTRPAHFPRNRVDWLGKMMRYYYRASLSGMLYDMFKNNKDIFIKTEEIFCVPESQPPGKSLRNEMIMNTILPLIESMRMDRGEAAELKERLYSCFESTQVDQAYGVVQRFHDRHGINIKDKRQKKLVNIAGCIEHKK